MPATATEYVSVVCLNGHLLQVTERLPAETSEAAEAALTIDGSPIATWPFPAWQRLRLGFTSSPPSLLLWSARDVRIIDPREGTSEVRFRGDEDILFVYVVAGGLLVVCETSVRYVDVNAVEMSRLEMPEVTDAAWLDGEHIQLRDLDGRVRGASIHGAELRAL